MLAADEIWRSREYWLENVRQRAPKSPILLVQTHCDQSREHYDQTAFAGAPYNAECLEFSACTDHGLESLTGAITRRLNEEIPGFGEDYPETYDRVLAAVEVRRVQNKISRPELDEICREAGITPGGETSVLEFLNRVGEIVWFPHVPSLEDTVFINPNWRTEQVYRLINNELRSRKGRITPGYIEEHLGDYTEEERRQFLELLERFELIFKAGQEGPDVYIAPQYLPDDIEFNSVHFTVPNTR